MACPDCYAGGRYAHLSGCPGEHVPDPVDCAAECWCGDEGESCMTFKPGTLEGGKHGFHGYYADGLLLPCKRCEGSGEYVPEIEEDVPEPDEDDPREDR